MAFSDLTPEQKKILEANGLKPFGSNNRLSELFLGVDKVFIKKGGVYNDKAIEETIKFTFKNPIDIFELIKMLRIEEVKEVQYCMCAGSYAMELYGHGQLKATIGLHHGISIRYDGWKGDANLSDGKSLLEWFASKGYKEPLMDFVRDNQ